MTRTVPLDYRTLPSYKALFLDYLHGYDKLAPFFAGDPYLPRSWDAVASSLGTGRHPRDVVGETLFALNRELGADELGLENARALGDRALAVVTGQQVGLFGGPLYTLYKALTAVRLARAAAKHLDRPVVPVFWMDADDHDFAEAQGTFVLGRDHEVESVRYEADDADDKLPVGSRPLDGSITDVVGRTFELLGTTEFKEDVQKGLEACYQPGRTMAEAFGSWLLKLTAGTGLIVIDPSRPELKSSATALFEKEMTDGPKSSALVERTTANLVDRGYHAQATPTEGHLNLFYAAPHREPINLVEGGFEISGGKETLSREALVERLREQPEHFSPNVLLRPLYQDTLLPTLAYVAGPNELAYFAQLKDVYEDFGVTMPLVASRSSFTIVEPPQSRFLKKYDVDVTKLSADDESLLNEILKRYTPPELDEDLTRARTCVQEITKALEKDLAKVDPSLGPTVKSTRGKLLHLLKELEGKAMKAVKRKHETVRSQFLSTRSALFPAFQMQERKLSVVGYLNKYGWHFSRLVEESADPEVKAHLLLEL